MLLNFKFKPWSYSWIVSVVQFGYGKGALHVAATNKKPMRSRRKVHLPNFGASLNVAPYNHGPYTDASYLPVSPYGWEGKTKPPILTNQIDVRSMSSQYATHDC